MNPEGSLPHLQVATICPYPKPAQSNPHPHIPLNMIIPSMPGYPQWALSIRFPHQNPIGSSLLPHLHYMPCSYHSSRFYRPYNIGWSVQIMKLLIMYPHTGFYYFKLLTYLCHNFDNFRNISGVDLRASSWLTCVLESLCIKNYTVWVHPHIWLYVCFVGLLSLIECYNTLKSVYTEAGIEWHTKDYFVSWLWFTGWKHKGNE
jgi:hypothetical protein